MSPDPALQDTLAPLMGRLNSLYEILTYANLADPRVSLKSVKLPSSIKNLIENISVGEDFWHLSFIPKIPDSVREIFIISSAYSNPEYVLTYVSDEVIREFSLVDRRPKEDYFSVFHTEYTPGTSRPVKVQVEPLEMLLDLEEEIARSVQQPGDVLDRYAQGVGQLYGLAKPLDQKTLGCLMKRYDSVLPR
jgi:hypothetical protein